MLAAPIADLQLGWHTRACDEKSIIYGYFSAQRMRAPAMTPPRQNESEIGADATDPAVALAFERYSEGDVAGAARLAQEALRTSKDPVGLRLVLGLCKRRQGRQTEAVAILREALDDAPTRADIWTLLGLCQRDLARRDEALKSFEMALAMNENFRRAQYQRAVVLQEMGEHAAAVEAFQAYVKTDVGKRHALAWSLLGVALRTLERFEESASAIMRAIALAPDDIPIRNSLVITHYVAGDDAQAMQAGRAALMIKDHYATKRFAEISQDHEPALVLTPRLVSFDPMARQKNIIAFSLWGDDPTYTHGAIINAQLAPHVYPGWRCRFYCDDTVPTPIIAELRHWGAEIRMIHDPNLKQLKPIWRFLASDDPEIDYFICRDADSRLNIQEALAVNDWVQSGLPFHVMRDHVYHMEVMLAGMWGGVAGVLPNLQNLTAVAHGYTRNKWHDQEFLRDVVWPLIRDHARVHDSLFRFRGAQDFPPHCRLPGKIHVGGAIKSMRPWPPVADTEGTNQAKIPVQL